MAVVRTRRIIDDDGRRGGASTPPSAAADEQRPPRRHRRRRPVGGELIELRRTQGAQIASSRVAVDKARTAAIFVRPSREIEEQVTSGRLGALALHGAAALTGGIPLIGDGEVVGAIGTSGETPDEDEAISIAGAAARRSRPTEVPALTYEGARLAAEAAGAVAAAARCRARSICRRRRRRRADVPRAPRRARRWRASTSRPTRPARPRSTAGRARTSRTRPRAAAPRRCTSPARCPLQGGIPIVHDGTRRRRDRRQRRLLGRRGPGARRSPAPRRSLRRAMNGARTGTRRSSRAPRSSRSSRPAACCSTTAGYKIDAGRREAPGEVEYHERVVDVMHVVEGTRDGRHRRRAASTRARSRPASCAPPRSRAARRTSSREGDVLAIPSGVPHQFVDVSDPFLYFVVKVEA